MSAPSRWCSHALLETWSRRSGSRMLLEDYEAVGGVAGAIAKTADDVLDQRLTGDERRAARRLLLRLVTPGEGTGDNRRRIEHVELDHDPEPDTMRRVVPELTNARLLTADDQSHRDRPRGPDPLVAAHAGVAGRRARQHPHPRADQPSRRPNGSKPIAPPTCCSVAPGWPPPTSGSQHTRASSTRSRPVHRRREDRPPASARRRARTHAPPATVAAPRSGGARGTRPGRDRRRPSWPGVRWVTRRTPRPRPRIRSLPPSAPGPTRSPPRTRTSRFGWRPRASPGPPIPNPMPTRR